MVERRLRHLGLGAVEAALRVPGLERNYLRDFLKGKKRSFSQSKLPLVAAALQWTVADLLGNIQQTNEPRLVTIPILDKVTAGRLSNPLSQIPLDDLQTITISDLGSGEYFALRVEGDSMNRISPEGAIIIVNRRDKTLINNKCYVFSLRGETTFKMWQADPPHFAPYSTNPTNKPIFLKKKTDAEIIGRVKISILEL